MSSQWRPSPSGRELPNRPSRASSLPTHSGLRRDTLPIPAGTVASRVKLLQSLSAPPPLRLPLPLFLPTPSPTAGTIPVTRHRYSRHHYQHKNDTNKNRDSCGLGRRQTNRFAAPTSRKPKAVPDDQDEVETAHSFPGVKATRTSHAEQQASYVPQPGTEVPGDYGVKGNGTPGFGLDRGLGSGLGRSSWRRFPPVYDAPVSENWTSGGTRRGGEANLFESPRGLGKQCVGVKTSSLCVSRATSKVQSPRRSSRQRSGTLGSQCSIQTTSTMRRRSVRDLFHEYGVQRPRGFASPTNDPGREAEGIRTLKADVCCHVCSFTNKKVQVDCQKCGHHFCSACPAFSEPVRSPFDCAMKRASSRTHDVERFDMRANSQNSPLMWTRLKVTRPGPSPVQRPKSQKDQLRGTPTLPAPSSNNGIALKRDEVTKSPQQVPSSVKRARTAQAQPVTRAVKSPEDSFSLADGKKIGYTPFQASSVPRNPNRKPGRVWEAFRCQEPPRSPRFDDGKCEKREPQDGQVTNARDKTSTGQVGVTGQTVHPYFPRPDSRTSRRSKSNCSNTPVSRPSSAPTDQGSSVPADQQVTEYVECYGYPRTGHGRCGSPVESGIVGECQHCLDDCECLACQSTHHQVRCCTNKDHPSIPHTHRTSRVDSGISQSTRDLSSSAHDSLLSVSPLSSPVQYLSRQGSSRSPQLLGSESPLGQEIPPCLSARPTLRSNRETNSMFKDPVPPSTVNSKVNRIGGRQNAISITSRPSHSRNRRYDDRQGNVLSPGRLRALSDLLTTSQSPVILPQKQKTFPIPGTADECLFSSEQDQVSTQDPEPKAMEEEKVSERVTDINKMADTSNWQRCFSDLRQVKQLHVLKMEEQMAISQQEARLPKKTSLFSNYKIGKTRKRTRRPSLLCPRRETSKTPTNMAAPGVTDKNQQIPAHVQSVEVEAYDQKDAIDSEGKPSCVWKGPVRGNVPCIMGITVIVHMSDSQDLIFKVDASMADARSG